MNDKVFIPITPLNLVYAQAELDYTHDYSDVEVGSIMIDRYGVPHIVGLIDKDDCGRRQFWDEQGACLTIQYSSPHNMLTKAPFYAYRYKVTGHRVII